MKKFITLATIAGLVLVTTTVSALTLGGNTKPVAGSPYANTDFTLPSPCMQTVIANYDNADMGAKKAYNDATEQAAQTRHNALVASWTITDKAARTAAYTSAMANYQSQMKNAQSTLKQATTMNRMTALAGAAACGEMLPNLVF